MQLFAWILNCNIARDAQNNSKGPVDCVFISIQLFDVQLNDSIMFCSWTECLQAIILLHFHKYQRGCKTDGPAVPCDAGLRHSWQFAQRKNFWYVFLLLMIIIIIVSVSAICLFHSILKNHKPFSRTIVNCVTVINSGLYCAPTHSCRHV